MTWIIIKQPHPLDSIWSLATKEMDRANDAMDALGDDFSSDDINAAAERRTEAIMAIMALPARHISDSIYKMDAAGIADGACRNDCDASAIINEMTQLLDEACARGAHLKREVPGLLEGVSFDAD